MKCGYLRGYLDAEKPKIMKNEINNTTSGKMLLNIQCVLIFSTVLFETSDIIRRIQQDIIINVHRYSFTVPIILVRF